MNNLLTISGAGALAALPAIAASAEINQTKSHKNGTSSPNFVFILVDDMGWTGLSTPVHDKVGNSKSDYYQTPQIAKLASQGVRFTNAYAPAPMCTT